MPAKNPRKTTGPETLQEAILYFSDPLNCLAKAIEFRWPNGITCPHCTSERCAFISSRSIWRCNGCKKQFSAKTGTIFEDSPLGWDKWFVALWLLVNAKNGVSSWELHRAIGVTQKTAWFVLHRLRLALGEDDPQEPTLSGTIEADETFIGGKAKNMHVRERKLKIQGRGAVGKAIVFGILERHPQNKKGKGKTQVNRVRALVVPDRTRTTLQPKVRAAVVPGSELFADAHAGYQGMDELVHQTVDHVERYVSGLVHTNSMENFWSLLKRALHGTYVSVECDHLGKYVDEEVFRFNARKDDDAGRFATALPGAVGKRLLYRELIARPEGEGPRRGKGATK
jgi:transposase-like protein